MMEKESKNNKKMTKMTPDTVLSPSVHAANFDNGDFEEAIKASIAATSRGNPDEDQMIEQAIRASVSELHVAGKGGDDEDALQRAIKVSVAEAARARKSKNLAMPADESDDGAKHDKELEDALHRSLTREERHPLADADFDDSGVDTEDDENIKAAIHQSTLPKMRNGKDKDLERAIKLSQQAQGEHAEQLSKIKTEEEIVLEYVKKQSLVEDQFKKSANTATTASRDHSPGEAELQKAMEESLKVTDEQSRG